jgi:hypothetical protein
VKHSLLTHPFQRTLLQGGVSRRHPGRLPHLAAVAIAWALLSFPNARTQPSAPSEYEVKAAYLYNFGRFVQWPAKAMSAGGDAFTICVLGEDPFGPALRATIAGETIGGKNVLATRISGPEQAVNCRILFISSSEDRQLKDILTTLEKASVLTVSDMPQFARRGGMVQFILQENRVRFEVNLATAQRAGLTLSSELLKLATSVRRSPQPGD